MVLMGDPLANYVKSLPTADANLPVKLERKLRMNNYKDEHVEATEILEQMEKWHMSKKLEKFISLNFKSIKLLLY
jgi:hypothetical protein